MNSTEMRGGGTDLSEYYPAWYKKRLEFGFCASDTVVIAVGRLDRNKNHKTILQAVEKIKDPSIQLVLCGDGEERSVLEKQVKKLDIEKQVHFLGNRSDMKELYAMSDVFVLASYREGLSRSIMEAMICGLPCIVSDIRGNRDLIEDGIGGYLVGPDDALGMAKRIEELTVDRNRRRIMGTVNYQKIRRFDVGKVIKILQKIYEEVF